MSSSCIVSSDLKKGNAERNGISSHGFLLQQYKCRSSTLLTTVVRNVLPLIHQRPYTKSPGKLSDLFLWNKWWIHMATSTRCHKTKPAFLHRNSLLKFFNLLSFWRTTKYFTANTVSLLIIVMLPFTALTESLLLSLSHLRQPPTELANHVLVFFLQGEGALEKES